MCTMCIAVVWRINAAPSATAAVRGLLQFRQALAQSQADICAGQAINQAACQLLTEFLRDAPRLTIYVQHNRLGQRKARLGLVLDQSIGQRSRLTFHEALYQHRLRVKQFAPASVFVSQMAGRRIHEFRLRSRFRT